MGGLGDLGLELSVSARALHIPLRALVRVHVGVHSSVRTFTPASRRYQAEPYGLPHIQKGISQNFSPSAQVPCVGLSWIGLPY